MIYFNGGLVCMDESKTQQEIWDFGMLVISLGQQFRMSQNLN